jgi:protein-tyrosine phosphatase
LKQLTPHHHHQQQQQQHRGSHSPTHPTHHQPQDTPLLCDHIEKKLVSAADRLLFKQRLFVPVYLVDSHPQSTRIRRMQRCFADSGCDSVPIHVLSCTLDVFRVTYPELMVSSNSHSLSNANSNSNSSASLHSEKILSAAHKRLFSSFSTSLVLHDFATEITPHIYLGCAQHAYSFQALKRHGVTHILNCARECVPYFPDSFTYYNLPLRDEESQDIVSVLDGACEFMEACRKQNGRVLVHCFAGVSRSAAIVAGYLMRSMGIEFDEVVQMLTARRPIVDMNAGFRRQLESLRAVQHRADCSS